MGADVRSDCQVTVEITASGGIVIDLESKVETMFGDSIRELVFTGMEHLNIRDAQIRIIDSGALPLVLMARIEAAARKCGVTEVEWLPEMIIQNETTTKRDRFRRSRLYLPGNTPKLMINAGIHKPDGIILDLEDSVSPEKKEEARIMVRNALRAIDFHGAERMVRINQIPHGLDDLDMIVPHNVNLILIPKCESARQVGMVEKRIAEIRKERKQEDRPIWLMPIIESALGVIRAYEIATASSSVVALAIGLEDYTADLGTLRTDEGQETFFARSQIVNAARAAGIQPIDSVFSNIDDMDALGRNVDRSKGLGFDGMGCIHPRQIPVIHRHFAPAEQEIEKAMRIVIAFEDAETKGLGVVSLGSKMIDPPVVKRALRTISLAVKSGLLPQDWRKQ